MAENDSGLPYVDSILHPTDFSEPSAEAFAHALAIALVRKATLTLLHVTDRKEDWRNFPAVRKTLERWNILDKDSRQEDVFEKLGIQVKKVGLKGSDALKAILAYLHDDPADLIVLATEGRDGVSRWAHPSLAEKLSRKSKHMTLFVPQKAHGFVSRETGAVSIQKILVPVDYEPSPLAAVEYASRVAGAVNQPVEIVLHHVKTGREMPAIDPPAVANVTWKKQTTEGEVGPELLRVAEKEKPQLLVLTTAGHQGFLDAVRGSITEQVIRKSPCPVLAIYDAERSAR